MKKIIFALALIFSINASAQTDNWTNNNNDEYYWLEVDILDIYGTPIYQDVILYTIDTGHFRLYIDTIDLTNIDVLKLPGTGLQYVKGDGSFATFPTIPTNTNQLTNGAGFLLSSDIAGKLNISDTAAMLAPYITSFTEVDGSTTNEIELPSQTGNSGKVLTTNGSSPSWTALKRQETYSGSTNSSGDYTVTFGTAYSVPPNIQAQIIGGNSNQVLTVTSVSTTGFTVKVVEKQTTTLLGIVVLQNSTANVNGANVDVLITEK